MTAKEFLSPAHELEIKIQCLKAEVEEYKDLASSISGSNFDREVVDRTRNTDAPYVRWVLKVCEKEEEIKRMETRLADVKGNILLAIDKLDNSTYRMVLLYRYIRWMTWDEISFKMYASSATVRRNHDKALELLALSEKLSSCEQR